MSKQGGTGFTIVELLIVIVVIGILAAITIVAYRGVQSRTYYARAVSELSSLNKATEVYHVVNNKYPDDVERNIPADLLQYVNGSTDNWPDAPWPNSVYDYDYFIGDDGREVSQISIRFCPIGGPLSKCQFPNEPWAKNFKVNSSAYWCFTGKCKPHPSEGLSYPGYCFNCKTTP